MGLDLERIEALCFDVDGTLMDTDNQIVERLSKWLNPFRALFPAQDPGGVARRIVMRIESPGNRMLHILDRVGLDGTYAALNKQLHHRGWRRLPTEFPLIPGALAALEVLKPRFRMSIVSARDALQVEAFVAHHSFDIYFQTIVSGQTRPKSKPYPDPILWAAKEMNVDPEACLMIGDTTVDIHAGRAAGAQTVAVLSGFGEAPELEATGADIILPSVAHLPAVLLS
jgi:phosphoglycolate phosphatase-like HAD superfamily hydrolase